MPPKAVYARNRLTRNRRFRGHGPLLQERHPLQRSAGHPPGDIQGALPLLVHPAGSPPRANRSERRAWARPDTSPPSDFPRRTDSSACTLRRSRHLLRSRQRPCFDRTDTLPENPLRDESRSPDRRRPPELHEDRPHRAGDAGPGDALPDHPYRSALRPGHERSLLRGTRDSPARRVHGGGWWIPRRADRADHGGVREVHCGRPPVDDAGGR